jgi:hypothetical protein
MEFGCFRGDWKMKAILKGILFISIFLVMASMLPVVTFGADYTCTFRGGREDAYVVVTDYDRDGNPMRKRGESFQGVIRRGQSQTIRSLYGKIRFSYRLYNQSRTSGRNFVNCEGGRIVQLP